MASNFRYNLSVDWISVEESTVFHQLDVIEQQLVDINDQESGGYIRVYIQGNAPDVDVDDEGTTPAALLADNNDDLIRNPAEASSSTESLQNAARFAFVTTSDENMADEADNYREDHPAASGRSPLDPDLDVISVFPSLSHEDLSTTLTARTSADSNRRSLLIHGLMASTSHPRSQSPEVDTSVASELPRTTVRGSASHERIEASHKCIQAGKAIGNLSGRSQNTSTERLSLSDRFPNFTDANVKDASATSRATGNAFAVYKVTRSSSTDELTAGGSLQIYDATGTFRIPSSPRSRKPKTLENVPTSRGDMEVETGGKLSTRSALRQTSSSTVPTLPTMGKDSTGSLPADAKDGQSGSSFKRKIYNLRSISSKRKLRKGVPMLN